MRGHTERLQTLMKRYTDAGIFEEQDHLKVNIVSDNDVPYHLLKRWQNRDRLTLDEHNELYYEMGIYGEIETK